MKIVVYEDRLGDTTGLKLLLLSLQKHTPNLPVDVIFPSAPDSFIKWIAKMPHVLLQKNAALKRSGYNVKPSLLLQMLNAGDTEVVWLDTDIIVVKDFTEAFARLPATNLAVSEEFFGAPHQGGTYRSKAWGLESVRSLPATTNTCVVRATPRHKALLHEWDRLLENTEYVAAQKRPWHERPIYHMGDQEVLCALLESSDFAETPVHYLRRGRDVAHCFQHQGYNIYQMLSNVVSRSKPYFVHGQGAKPWRGDNQYRGFLDVSAYTLCAAEYRNDLEEDVKWLTPSVRSSIVARKIFSDDPWLTGLPSAFVAELMNQRLLKTTIKQILGKS